MLKCRSSFGLSQIIAGIHALRLVGMARPICWPASKRSLAFSTGYGSAVRHSEGYVSTTWLATFEHDGTPADLVAEDLLGLPTCYPCNPEMDGLSGDYQAFRLAQEFGISAEQYALRNGENTGDTSGDYQRRLSRLAGMRGQMRRAA